MSRISEIIDLYMAIAKIPKAKFQKKNVVKLNY
ncbi:unknown [Tannerella sp. CAG:118]|nr:unknown [Tannerella sp. CAG:118]